MYIHTCKIENICVCYLDATYKNHFLYNFIIDYQTYWKTFFFLNQKNTFKQFYENVNDFEKISNILEYKLL